MKIAVIFHRKKFMVVVAGDGTIQDLKVEISRVYQGLCPTCSSPPPISELQTHTGCVLFDGYTVSSVLTDNDVIIATSGSADSEGNGTTYAMPTSVQGSPVCWPYYGFSPMATYSPMLTAQMVYNRSPASSTLLPDPLAASAPSSLLATPTKSLFQSPSTRTVSVQYPSPRRTESESELDISVCSPALPTPPSGSAAVEKQTQAVETVQVPADVDNNSHVLNASSRVVEEEPDLPQASVEEEHSPRSVCTSTGGDITVLPCSGEDLRDSGVKQNKVILKKIVVALHNSGNRGTATTSPKLSQSAKKVGKRKITQTPQNHTTSNGDSTAAGGSSSEERPALSSAVGRPRRVASQTASRRMREIFGSPTGVTVTRDYPAPVTRKRTRGLTEGSEDEWESQAKRKMNLEKHKKTRQQSNGVTTHRINRNSAKSDSDWSSSDSEEDGQFLHSARKDTSTVDKQKPPKISRLKGETQPILLSSSDWTSSDEDDRSENLRNSKLKGSNQRTKRRGGSQSSLSATEKQSVVDSSISQIVPPPAINSTSESLPSQPPSQHSGQAGDVILDSVDPPSSSPRRTRKVVPRVTQGEEQSTRRRSSRRKKGLQETPQAEDSPRGEEGEKTDVQESAPHLDLDQQRSQSSVILDASRVTSTESPAHVIESQGQEAHDGVESHPREDMPAETVLDAQGGIVHHSTHDGAEEESASTTADEGAGDQTPHEAASERQDENSVPEQPEQFGPSQVMCEEVGKTFTSSSASAAVVNSASNTVDSESSLEVLAADSVAEEEIVMTAQLQEDAVTVIQETQDLSRSPSPEIPFLGQVETQQSSCFLSKQKVNEHVTLHDTHKASNKEERPLLNGPDTVQTSGEHSEGDSSAARVASSQSDTQAGESPSKLKKLKLKNIVTDLDLGQWDSSDTAVSANACEESSRAHQQKKKKTKRQREDEQINVISEENAKSAFSISSDASESGLQLKKKKRRRRLSQVRQRTVGGSGEDEVTGNVDDVNSCETIPETQINEPSTELETQDGAHTTPSASHEESVRESMSINESQTQPQNGDLSTVEPTEDMEEASRVEEEEDHGHSSVSESETSRTQQSKHSQRTLAETSEDSPSNLQCEDAQSDSSCFVVEQPAVASELTATSVAEMKSMRRRKRGKEKKHRKTVETHPPGDVMPIDMVTEETTTPLEGENVSLPTPSSQKKGLKKKLRHNMTGTGDVSSEETPATSLSLNNAQSNGPSSISGEKMPSRDKPTAPTAPKKSAANTTSPATALKSPKLHVPTPGRKKGGIQSVWSPNLVAKTKKSKPKDNSLSIFSVTETERSSEDSSGGEQSARHARLKKPRKPSLLSALGNHGKATKPSVLKFIKKTPSLPTTQRRFSSETAMRMFSLTHSPHSAAKKAKSRTTPAISKHPPSNKHKKELGIPLGELSHADEETSGDVPSLSELLADGSLWDS